jgi:hypothetical protein
MRETVHRMLGCIVLIGFGFGPAAYACTTDGWLGGTDGVPSNAVAGSPPAVSRYSELCALAVTGQAHVQSNNASDARYRARFYVLDNLSGEGVVDIFEAYSDDAATSPLFKVSFDGSTFVFNATAAGGTSGEAGASSGWNLIEFDWDSDTNTFTFWVNANAAADPASGSADAGAGMVEAVRLGAPNGFSTQTGKLTFDAFESHRMEAVGALLAGDSNGNGSVNIFDMISIQNEILDPLNKLAAGQPDCNGNGSVNVFDMICVQNIILGR